LVFLLKGNARVDDKCILAEWLCTTETGTLREPFKVEMLVIYSQPSIQLDKNMASSSKTGKPIENILAGALAN
jgi:hypothetical protein